MRRTVEMDTWKRLEESMTYIICDRIVITAQ